MSVTSDAFNEFVALDLDDDDTIRLGQTLSALVLDVEVDSAEVVRNIHRRV